MPLFFSSSICSLLSLAKVLAGDERYIVVSVFVVVTPSSLFVSRPKSYLGISDNSLPGIAGNSQNVCCFQGLDPTFLL